MYGVLVNAIAIAVGGLIGLMLRGGISDRFQQIINHALALCVLLIGLMGAIKTENLMLMIVCTVLGSIIGEALKIETGLEKLGGYAQRKFAKGDSTFSQSFVSATLLFCVGAMAVVGSLEAGLTGKADTLLAKSALDGVSSIIFASSLGPGVIFSAIPLLIYQGAIALLSGSAQSLLSADVIREMSAVGSILILSLGINMLNMTPKRIRVGNMLPAMLLPIAYIPLMNWIASLMK
ncbi:DUF554 domain-containing protein [Eubacteriales bacterium OttesenSCG-928-N13]|nr:DUF554 domain-containing protein [Eubacteriales bacterium OttesenSCG-928-N13]